MTYVIIAIIFILVLLIFIVTGNYLRLKGLNQNIDICSNNIEEVLNKKKILIEKLIKKIDDEKLFDLYNKLTDELVLEGIAREMVSKVQQLRKNKDFNVADRITLYYNGDEDIDKCVESFKEYIQNETLATSIVKKDNLTELCDLNGHECYIDVER